MTLTWDEPADRVYETGLDRGVLYLPDGTAVPWNGLTSVTEASDKEVTPVYYDGMKIYDVVTLGNFSATMKAITYPDEFLELEGLGELKSGIFADEQMPKLFGLSYRTQIGNPVDGDVAGYKIHLLYNVLAIPSEVEHITVSDQTQPIEFQWTLHAVPEEIPGLRPTAHYIINTLETDPLLLEDLEELLYGSDDVDASLLPMHELLAFITSWYRIRIVDNGDGTWTASSDIDGLINMLTADTFEIVQANATYLDAHTYVISDTSELSDVT